MRKEDYNIISTDNKVYNYQIWIKNPNMINDVSENPYPVMYIENKAVYEGDKLLFNVDDKQILREVKWQHRFLINKQWIKLWSLRIK